MSIFIGILSVCFSMVIEFVVLSFDFFVGVFFSLTALAVLLFDFNFIGVLFFMSVFIGLLLLIKLFCGVDSGVDVVLSFFFFRVFVNVVVFVFFYVRFICCSFLYCFFFLYNFFFVICILFLFFMSVVKFFNDILNIDLSCASIVSRFIWFSFASSAVLFECVVCVVMFIVSKYVFVLSVVKMCYCFVIYCELCFVVCGVLVFVNNLVCLLFDMIVW